MEKLNIYEVLKNEWFTSAIEGYICEKMESVCKKILENKDLKENILNYFFMVLQRMMQS